MDCGIKMVYRWTIGNRNSQNTPWFKFGEESPPFSMIYFKASSKGCIKALGLLGRNPKTKSSRFNFITLVMHLVIFWLITTTHKFWLKLSQLGSLWKDIFNIVLYVKFKCHLALFPSFSACESNYQVGPLFGHITLNSQL